MVFSHPPDCAAAAAGPVASPVSSPVPTEPPVALPVIQWGHPQLRQVAQPVTQFESQALQGLIDNLLHTCQVSDGVGIAAPQVGEGQQLLVVASRPNARYPDAPMMAPTAMLNPRILATSGETVKGWEGCLSVPGLRGLVPRDRAIEVAYQDRWGEEHRQWLTDFVARIFQHEYDHLQGKVFLDRVENPLELISETAYQRRMAAIR